MTLLRQNQIDEMRSERQSLQRALNDPKIEDKGTVAKQIRRLDHQLETQTPKPFSGPEIDVAARREKELREQLVVGMPSQEEMRKSPPGAVGKHMEWERRNKKALLEWKDLRLRLNTGSDDPDVANFERYRPKQSSLNMDNAFIAGRQYFMPSEQYKENYDQVFKLPEDPVAPPEPEKATKSRPTISEEERERRRQRMREFHEKRKAASSQEPPSEG